MSDKTEPPTPRRMRKARQEGNTPVSSALIQSVGFLAALCLAPAALGALVARSATMIHSSLTEVVSAGVAYLLVQQVLVVCAPMLVAGALAAAMTGLVQTGGVMAPKRIAPDLSRLNPLTGVGNLFSLTRLVALLRALVAACLVGYLAVAVLRAHLADVVATVGNVPAAAVVTSHLLKQLTWDAGLLGLALALIDLLVTHHSWRQRLRMSKEEVKREYRETEGDPEIKAARRRAHEEALKGATIAAVRQATVLVINPTRLATALLYRQDEDEAPRVVAQGSGELARHMIDAARAYGVPIVRDVPVARALQEIEVGEEIPEALYEAVAEILRDAWEQAEKEEKHL